MENVMIAFFKEKFNIFTGRVVQATPACLMAMVQGNVTAITSGHWIKALETGASTGLLVIAASLAFKEKEIYENKYVISALTSIATMIADYAMHPSHFGGPSTEAIVTGLAAGVLCFIMAKTNLDKKLLV